MCLDIQPVYGNTPVPQKNDPGQRRAIEKSNRSKDHFFIVLLVDIQPVYGNTPIPQQPTNNTDINEEPT